MEAHQQQVQLDLNKVHNGIHQTLVNSRTGMFGSYITHAKQVIKGIIGSCPVCRRLAKIPSNAKKLTKPELGHFNKVNLQPFKYLKEYKILYMTVVKIV